MRGARRKIENRSLRLVVLPPPPHPIQKWIDAPDPSGIGILRIRINEPL